MHGRVQPNDEKLCGVSKTKTANEKTVRSEQTAHTDQMREGTKRTASGPQAVRKIEPCPALKCEIPPANFIPPTKAVPKNARTVRV